MLKDVTERQIEVGSVIAYGSGSRSAKIQIGVVTHIIFRKVRYGTGSEYDRTEIVITGFRGKKLTNRKLSWQERGILINDSDLTADQLTNVKRIRKMIDKREEEENGTES